MNRKKIFKIIMIIMQVVLLIFTFNNTVLAVSSYYQIYDNSYNPFYGTITKIVGILQAVGMSVAVIMLAIIGIRFLIASPEGKAELKQQLFPYFIGCILLFGGAWLLSLVAKVAGENFMISE